MPDCTIKRLARRAGCDFVIAELDGGHHQADARVDVQFDAKTVADAAERLV